MENLAQVLNCGARSNLTLSETTTLRLLVALTAQLDSLLGEFAAGVRPRPVRDAAKRFVDVDQQSVCVVL